MYGTVSKILKFAAPVLLVGCAEVHVQPTDMAIEYQFLDSSDEIFEACGKRAEACARVIGSNCIITLPTVHWDQHLVHEMRHCFGGLDSPAVAISDW